MKKTLFLIVISMYCSNILIAQVRVKGYYKKDGTYVKPHVRSNPDGYIYNNWSTKGNVNPYTGKEGTKNPLSAGSYGNEYNTSYPDGQPMEKVDIHAENNENRKISNRSRQKELDESINEIWYYSEDWKAISKNKASYYRVIRKESDNQYLFTDYYITGEKQSEGYAIYLDKYNDHDSKMNGKVTFWYKSGRISAVHPYMNGLLTGYLYQYPDDDSKKYIKLYYNINGIPDTYYYNVDGNGNETICRLDENNRSKSLEKPNGSKILMIYFEKKGSEFEEEFSIENKSGEDINEIYIRFIYKDMNGVVLDYKDHHLDGKIPNGLSKKYTVRSFDQSQHFAYKYSDDHLKQLYKLFTVEYKILYYR
jgi:hypothetical protein